jgi:hypothetical protein
MNSKWVSRFTVVTMLGVGLATSAMAGNGFGDNMEKKRDADRSEQRAEQPQAAQPRAEQPRSVQHAGGQRAPAAAASGAPPPGYVQRGNHIGGPAAAAGNIQHYGRPSGGNGNWNGNGGGYRNRPPQYVNTLPYGYVRHNWNGRPYYYQGGRWYRPYGTQFIIAGPPFGLFVDFLPNYYTSFWVGSTRYYYADDTYYTYEPARRGYVVSRSPYNDDDQSDESADSASNVDQDLYIYPSRGQSEQQQADDKYECHRWAADQAHYDPTDSQFNAQSQTEYKRAMTACLTGKGYSVR